MSESSVTRTSGIRIGGVDDDAVADISVGTRTRGARSDGFVEVLRRLDGALRFVDAVELRGGATRDGGVPAPRTVTVPPGDGDALLLVQDDASGLWSWQLPDRSGKSDEAAAFELADGATRAGTRAQRGVTGAVAGRVGRFVVLRLGGLVIDRVTGEIARRFEAKYRKPRLRTFTPDSYKESAQPGPVDDFAALAAGRSLLLLHDAFGLSHTSFGQMPGGLVTRLSASYDGRVWAYDHPTLTPSPHDNAAELVRLVREQWAGGMQVDVLAHGRGGLIARELVELPPEGSPFEVGSVVFVGTPNAGTPLCDEKELEKLVQRCTNLLALIPDNPVVDAIETVATIFTAVASRAAGRLFGLTSMAPDGAYLRVLNTRPAGRTGSTRYYSIGSDYAPPPGTDLSRKLGNMAADALLSGPNDLIVPTASVWSRGPDDGLVPLSNRVEFGPRDAVTHNGYWHHPAFTRQLSAWLDLPPVAPSRSRGTPAEAGIPDSRPAEGGCELQTVTVNVVHASAEFATHPVVVGHFVGSPIEGAEEFLDRRLDRRLTAHQQLGGYPEHIGQSLTIRLPELAEKRARRYPPGAIIVGLDKADELTRERLTLTVTRALVRYAAEELDKCLGRRPEEPVARVDLGFSAVTIGTVGLGAISPEGSVGALVDAVAAANDELFRHRDPHTNRRAWDLVRISDLEIVELYADRAETAAQAIGNLDRLQQVGGGEHTRFQGRPEVVSDPDHGGLPALSSGDTDGPEWLRVIITSPTSEARARNGDGPQSGRGPGISDLEFTAIGRRARADRLTVTVDTDTIDTLVEAARQPAGVGAQVANTLYELILPHSLKAEILRTDNVHLLVDQYTADIPWEALAARVAPGDDCELAQRGGLLRQFRETEGMRPEIRTPVGSDVLVIGNPPPPEGYDHLPGARDEAQAVITAFRNHRSEPGFTVRGLVWDGGIPDADDFTTLVGSPGRRVLDALFSREWRVIHIAAHGRFDPDDPARSGVLVDSRTTITPNIIRQLPVVPELVFLNCCHLGRLTTSLDHRPNQLAASVSRELMRAGVRAVVAAGWAVDDHAAERFATSLYEQLLAGSSFGEAVLDARRRLRREFRTSMTWAAYQCYGDRGYRLNPSGATTTRSRTIVSASQRQRRIQTITTMASRIGIPDYAELAERESEFVAELDEHYEQQRAANDPTILYELGRAYAELGRFAPAVDCYRRAWSHPKGNRVPVQALEQLGNMEIRLAHEVFLDTDAIDRFEAATTVGSSLESVRELVTASEEHTMQALALGETGERLALAGSFYARLAAMSDGEQRQQYVAHAAEQYGLAHEWQLRTQEGTEQRELEAYYTLSWLQLSHIAHRPPEAGQATALIDAIKGNCKVTGEVGSLAVGDPIGDVSQDYWERARAADLKLTCAVVGWEADADELAVAYQEAFSTRCSRRNRTSSLDNVRRMSILTDIPAIEEALRILNDQTAAGPPPATGPAGVVSTGAPPATNGSTTNGQNGSGSAASTAAGEAADPA